MSRSIRLHHPGLSVDGPNCPNARRSCEPTRACHSLSRPPAGGVTDSASRLFQLQQPFEIAALQFGAQRVAEPLADRFQDLAGALHVDLIGHRHRVAEVRPPRGAGTAEWIAVGVLLAAAFLTVTVLA